MEKRKYLREGGGNKCTIVNAARKTSLFDLNF